MRRTKFPPVLIFSFVYIIGHAQDFVQSAFSPNEGRHSESYQSFTFNGSWCWFSDPRAVYFEGEHKRTYAGWVDNFGDITIGYYDHQTHQIQTHVLFDQLEIDDHDNPSLLFDEQGKMIVFFNKHSDAPLYQIKALKPESIDAWGEVKSLFLNEGAPQAKGSMSHTYTNPIKLSGENGRIYLFWRGLDGKPSFSYSDDNGLQWSPGKVFFMPEPIYGFRRPYVKIYSDGKDKIHFCLTDGHPRNEEHNSIYYMYYQKGAFYKANGEKIKNIDRIPIKPAEADLVYDGKIGGAKAWNFDIAQNENGHPVVAYANYPDDENHIYAYAIFNQGKWNNYNLVNSGKWFPETVEDQEEPEQNYSGGMSIDHENTNTLYLSVNRDSVFEIEKWVTNDFGVSWEIDKITNSSSKDNVRPFAIRGAKSDNPLQVLWLQNTRYIHYAYGREFKERFGGDFKDRFHSSIKMNLLSPNIEDPLATEDIKNIMRQTADWQLANPFPGIELLDWHNGALYTGIRAMYEVTGEDRYRNELYNIGQSQQWKPMDDVFHADRLTVLDTWNWLYELEKDPGIIEKGQWAMDMHLARAYKKATDVTFQNNPYYLEWWTWCDALYMAPPSFLSLWKVTGDEKYLTYMDEQYWKTVDYLYSKADSLFYRDDRFFDQLSDNGKKIFWSRGNGWVIAGLARMLRIMPTEFEGRKKYEKLFSEMAHKLLYIQNEDGLWRVSLLDPEYLNMGESSGSSFFTFALAWGLNNNLIDQRYQPQIEKAWTALCGNVNDQGRLGFVQQVAGDPYPFYAHQWQVYATGAFLLAGQEMVEMAK